MILGGWGDPWVRGASSKSLRGGARWSAPPAGLQKVAGRWGPGGGFARIQAGASDERLSTASLVL